MGNNSNDLVLDALNKNAMPGVRWVRKGSPEAREAAEADKIRRIKEAEGVRKALELREPLRPVYDLEDARDIFRRLPWRWAGSVRVNREDDVLWWLCCCAAELGEDESWVQDNWSEAQTRYSKARGWRGDVFRPFDLGWDGDWNEFNRAYSL